MLFFATARVLGNTEPEANASSGRLNRRSLNGTNIITKNASGLKPGLPQQLLRIRAEWHTNSGFSSHLLSVTGVDSASGNFGALVIIRAIWDISPARIHNLFCPKAKTGHKYTELLFHVSSSISFLYLSDDAVYVSLVATMDAMWLQRVGLNKGNEKRSWIDPHRFIIGLDTY